MLEPRVASLPLPAVGGSVPGPPKPSTDPSVPFPARLLDRAMPRLSDTEWRLLCVVVRQTLGWYDKETGGRKGRDWLTQSQLVARTGRTAKPIAQAVASLTARRLIRVASDRGEALLTPEQRRGCPGRHWFQLHPQWEKAWTVMEGVEPSLIPRPGESPHGESPHGVREQEERVGTGRPEDGGTFAPDGSREEGRGRGTGDVATPRLDLWAEACGVFTVEKVHTTKETDHKYIGANKYMSESMKQRTGFFHNAPSRDARSLPRTERAGVEARSTLGELGGGGRRGRKALTIYGPSDAEAHMAWEPEAAGERWTWRKDLARWTPHEPGSKECDRRLIV